MAEPYADGSQAVITTPDDGLAKYLIDGERFEAVHFLPLERRTLDFDWGILLLENGLGIATEQQRERFVVFGDAQPGDPRSPLEVKRTIPVDEATFGKIGAHFTLSPDGRLIVLTDKKKLLAIEIETGRILSVFDLPETAGISIHNSFPMDETGRIYLSAQTKMAAIDWTGQGFALAWTASYDMRGPGCEDVDPDRRLFREAIAVARGETCTGSGTTPTLIGTPQNGVAVIVDGHSPQNNLIAFWRGEPPADWEALDDPTGRSAKLDRRVAGVFPLPYSTPEGRGYTAENSPAALGAGIVIAQWAGFAPRRNDPRGLQRVDWNPEARALELRWANPDIHFNGVPTIACETLRSCQAYGMGRYGGRYQYTSVDFETGRETGRIDLGRDDSVLDQGNNHAVANDGSIVYSGKYQMLRVR